MVYLENSSGTMFWSCRIDGMKNVKIQYGKIGNGDETTTATAPATATTVVTKEFDTIHEAKAYVLDMTMEKREKENYEYVTTKKRKLSSEKNTPIIMATRTMPVAVRKKAKGRKAKAIAARAKTTSPVKTGTKETTNETTKGGAVNVPPMKKAIISTLNKDENRRSSSNNNNQSENNDDGNDNNTETNNTDKTTEKIIIAANWGNRSPNVGVIYFGVWTSRLKIHPILRIRLKYSINDSDGIQTNHSNQYFIMEVLIDGDDDGDGQEKGSSSNNEKSFYLYTRQGPSLPGDKKKLDGPYPNEIDCRQKFEEEFYARTGMDWNERQTDDNNMHTIKQIVFK